MANICVLGAGTWGIALARMLAVNGNSVTVWSALPEELAELSATKKHKNLPGMVLPDSLRYEREIGAAVSPAEVVLFAVPSVFVRGTARQAQPHLHRGQIIVDVAKGIETDSLLTMSQIIQQELSAGSGSASLPVVALSGPTHAEEVALDMPTAIVAACPDEDAARKIQDIFMNPNFRVYTNKDIIGVEIGGALKNVIALCVGISRGLGYGDNARAALITRGNAEMARLGAKMGGEASTFMGLAGLGDLIVTCTSMHSRNLRAGILIGQSKTKEEAKAEVGMVVEGLYALDAAVQLAEKYQVEMPIIHAADSVINHGRSAREVVDELMQRKKKAE